MKVEFNFLQVFFNQKKTPLIRGEWWKISDVKRL